MESGEEGCGRDALGAGVLGHDACWSPVVWGTCRCLCGLLGGGPRWASLDGCVLSVPSCLGPAVAVLWAGGAGGMGASMGWSGWGREEGASFPPFEALHVLREMEWCMAGFMATWCSGLRVLLRCGIPCRVSGGWLWLDRWESPTWDDGLHHRGLWKRPRDGGLVVLAFESCSVGMKGRWGEDRTEGRHRGTAPGMAS